MSIKYYNFQPRLKLYYNLIGLYDFLDKNKFCKTESFLESVNIKNTWFFDKAKDNKIDFIILKEFLAQQRIFLKKNTKNIKLSYEYFIITLRKLNFYFLNEFFLNLLIINNFNKYIYFSKKKFINIFESINFYNLFFNHFSNKLFKNCTLKSHILLDNKKCINQKVFLSYFFLC